MKKAGWDTIAARADNHQVIHQIVAARPRAALHGAALAGSEVKLDRGYVAR